MTHQLRDACRAAQLPAPQLITTPRALTGCAPLVILDSRTCLAHSDTPALVAAHRKRCPLASYVVVLMPDATGPELQLMLELSRPAPAAFSSMRLEEPDAAGFWERKLAAASGVMAVAKQELLHCFLVSLWDRPQLPQVDLAVMHSLTTLLVGIPEFATVKAEAASLAASDDITPNAARMRLHRAWTQPGRIHETILILLFQVLWVQHLRQRGHTKLEALHALKLDKAAFERTMKRRLGFTWQMLDGLRMPQLLGWITCLCLRTWTSPPDVVTIWECAPPDFHPARR